MCESQPDGNGSINSNDSNNSNYMRNENTEKLNALINMESKHSSVYYDLYSKNNILRVDLENLCNSCKRFENQKKMKSEILEECYEKLIEYQKRSQVQLQEKLSSIIQKLEKTNSFFYEAFDNYSSEVLKNSIKFFDNESQQIEKKFKQNTEQLNSIRTTTNITESLMNLKLTQLSNIDMAKNILFESLMKRPQIEIEEKISKLTNEIKILEEKREKMKLIISKHK